MYLTRLLVNPLSSVAIIPLFLYLINPITYVNWIFTEGIDSMSDVVRICIGPFPYIHISLM